MLNTYYTKKVLCHEIVHAAMYIYNIILTYDEEETIAELITNFGEEIIELTNKLFSTMSKQKKKEGTYLIVSSLFFFILHRILFQVFLLFFQKFLEFFHSHLIRDIG